MNTAIVFLALAATGAHAADAGNPEQQIRAALAHWVEAANRGDYPSAFSVWAPDLIGWAPDGSTDSYAQEKKFADLPQRPPQTTYALQIDEVIVDGTLAVVRDTWTQTTHVDSGDKVETFHSFEIWRTQPDRSWKISRWIDGPMLTQPTLTQKK